MTMRTVLLSCALACSLGVVPGPPRASAGEKAKGEPSAVDLSGRWVLNRERSDDARESMRAILEPAEELTIEQGASEVTIDERFGRMRRLHPDGKKYKTDNGASELKTSWKEGRLLVETKGSRGGGVVETWELVPDRSRIIVSVKMEGGVGPGVVLKRIYDRAKEGEPR